VIDIRELNKILNGLVFDRTQSDVDHAINHIRNGLNSEQDLKGAYNISDRNRAAQAAKHIAGCMRSNGMYDAAVKIRDNWNTLDIIRHEDNEDVLAALRYLRSLMPTAETPAVPAELDNLTYVKANIIERVLFDLCCFLARLLDSWMYFGDGFASGFDPHNWQGWDS